MEQYTTHIERYDKKTGTYYPPDVNTVRSYVPWQLPTAKESVDTGGFVPGIYRVNPYTITGATYSGSNYAFTCLAYDSWFKYVITVNCENSFESALSDALRGYLLTGSTVDMSWGRTRALQGAYAGISGGIATYGTELGELKETLAFLKNPLKSFMELIKARKFFKGPKSFTAKLNENYLVFRFALSPLISSVTDALALIKDGLPSFEPDKIYSYHGYTEAEPVVVKTGLIQVAGTHHTFFASYEITEEYKCNAAVQVTYEVPPGISDILGLSIFDVPGVVWELTRLSFIIDRFVSIGSWLDRMRFTPHVNVLGNTLGVKRIVRARVKGPVTYRSSWDKSPKPTDYLPDTEAVWSSYHREIDADDQNLPAVNWQLAQSPIQVLDEIAIILQTLRNAK